MRSLDESACVCGEVCRSLLMEAQRRRLIFKEALNKEIQETPFLFLLVGDKSPYVILSIFSVIFSRFYHKNIGVLDQLSMILGHFYCFLYLSL